MEITLAFVQGILTIIGIMVVLGVVWALRQIDSVKRQIEHMEYRIGDVDLIIQNRIDRESSELYTLIHDHRRELESLVDSRVDKLYNQVTKV